MNCIFKNKRQEEEEEKSSLLCEVNFSTMKIKIFLLFFLFFSPSSFHLSKEESPLSISLINRWQTKVQISSNSKKQSINLIDFDKVNNFFFSIIPLARRWGWRWKWETKNAATISALKKYYNWTLWVSPIYFLICLIIIVIIGINHNNKKIYYPILKAKQIILWHLVWHLAGISLFNKVIKRLLIDVKFFVMLRQEEERWWERRRG